MRVTLDIDIDDDLLLRAEQYAAERGITLSAHGEEGLRLILPPTGNAYPFPTFSLPSGLEGLRPGYSWDRISHVGDETESNVPNGTG